MANIIRFEIKDKLCLKKKHPCGADIFTVARCGSDVRIICDGCGRDLTLSREALEKHIKKVITTEKITI
jgi:hypothetical protein